MQFQTDTGMAFFLPPTDWKTRSNNKARLDITYHTGRDSPAAVNISLWGKKSIPVRVTSVSLNTENVEYTLSNIKVLFADSRKRELRITGEGDRDTLPALLEAEQITLIAEIDGVQYIYTPNKHYYRLKTDFLISISY